MRGRCRNLVAVCASAAFAALAFPAAGLAQLDGELDLSFDGPGAAGNGKWVHSFSAGTDRATDVVVQSNGKIVAIGVAGTDLALARFNANGSLDSSFNGPSGTGAGDFTLSLGAGTTTGQSITLDSLGRIVIAGTSPVAGSDFFVARLDASDGDFDTSFDTDGVAGTSFSAGTDVAREVVVDASDRPVVVGGSAADVAVARFETDGDLDPAFDGPGAPGNGKFSFDIAGSEVISNVVIQPTDSKIVLSGRASTGGGGSDWALARFNPADGSFDTSFDGPASSTTPSPGAGNGKFAVPLTAGLGQDSANALAIQGTNKILVGGEAGAGGSFAIGRFNVSDGDLDASFDGDGIVTTNLGSSSDIVQDLKLDTKGRIVAAGQSFNPGNQFAALRYTANGSLDAFFDSDSGTANGAFAFGVGVSASSQASALAIESDGDLVLAGDGNGTGTGTDFALARLKVDLIEPNTLTTGPSGPTNNTDPVFTISSTETASSVACTIDSVSTPCVIGGGQQFGPFADGAHTFTAAAVDLSGNPDSTPSVRNFTVDTVAPNGSITSGTGLSNDSTPSIGFSSSEGGSTFQCKLDSPLPGPPGSFGPCTPPFNAGPLPDGTYTISVRTTDAATNLDPSDAVANFTIDTVAPSATITTAPAALSSDPTPTIAFSTNDGGSTFQCKLDPPAPAPAGSFGACTSPFNAGPLPDGTYSFTLRNTDAAGNVDPSDAAVTFAVDTAAPKVTITAGPPAQLKAKKKSAVASFRFSSDDPGAKLECSLDGAPFAACSSPFSAGLKIGSHNFSVRARDAAGNVSAATSRAVKVTKKKRKKR